MFFGLYKRSAIFPLADSEICWLLTNKRNVLRNQLLHKMADGLLEGNYSQRAARCLQEVITKLVKAKEARLLLPIAAKLAKWSHISPVHIELLLKDAPGVAAVFLEKIENLSDEILLNWIEDFGDSACLAVVKRKTISKQLSSAIIKKSSKETLLQLLKRHDIEIDTDDLERIRDQYEDEKYVIQILTARPDIPIDVLRHDVFVALDNLYNYMKHTQFMTSDSLNEVFQQGYDSVIIGMAANLSPKMFTGFIRRMKNKGYISITLFYRAIMLRDIDFVIDAFVALSERDRNNVKTLIMDGGDLGYEFLAQDVGLDKSDMPNLHMLVEVYKQLDAVLKDDIASLSFCFKMIEKLQEMPRNSSLELSEKLKKLIHVLIDECQDYFSDNRGLMAS